jgi:hypothetical protein
MTADDRMMCAPSISEAWREAAAYLVQTPGHKAVHLVLRIDDPRREIPLIRKEVDGLIASDGRDLPAVDTTRNTIFPAAWARRFPEPADLAEYYRSRYDELRQYGPNARGTYFGRIVAYPRDGAEFGDQLSGTVRKLRQELAHGRGPKSSRYEVNIFSESVDTSAMSFPCLAHVSFHLHSGQLHMQAVYRNEYLVARAYGNFLGLGQLLGYVADAVGLATGELLMTINHADLDGNVGPVRRALSRLSHVEG